MGRSTQVSNAIIGLAAIAVAWLPVAVNAAAYNHSFLSIDGKPMPLSQFRGRVLLVVNTASMCGFTPQYQGLQKLHETYERSGLVVIGIPSNDFGGQEPNNEADVKTFCQGAFGITFPLTAKSRIVGSERHSFYAWASQTNGAANGPRWNFHKYLVGRDGQIAASFSTRTEPQSAEVIAAIEAELAKPVPQMSPAL